MCLRSTGSRPWSRWTAAVLRTRGSKNKGDHTRIERNQTSNYFMSSSTNVHCLIEPHISISKYLNSISKRLNSFSNLVESLTKIHAPNLVESTSEKRKRTTALRIVESPQSWELLASVSSCRDKGYKTALHSAGLESVHDTCHRRLYIGKRGYN